MNRLQDIGERQAIKHLFDLLSDQPSAGQLGDDCARIEYGKDYLVLTSDMIHQHTHIPPQMTPSDLGWFLVAINLSDLACCGATPLGLLLSYGLPADTTDSYLTQLTKGALCCCTTYNTEILGGDLKESETISLCGTAIGRVRKHNYLGRHGMKPGEVVAVSGTLGKAGAGYYALQHNNASPDTTKHLFRPTPQLPLGQLLSKQKGISTCMDLSDGLSSSLYQLGERNTLGFDIDEQTIPIAAELKHLSDHKPELNPLEIALHFGGDYELVFTCDFNDFERIQNKAQQKGYQITAIGTVTKTQRIHRISHDTTTRLENKGYEHFRPHHF